MAIKANQQKTKQLE